MTESVTKYSLDYTCSLKMNSQESCSFQWKMWALYWQAILPILSNSRATSRKNDKVILAWQNRIYLINSLRIQWAWGKAIRMRRMCLRQCLPFPSLQAQAYLEVFAYASVALSLNNLLHSVAQQLHLRSLNTLLSSALRKMLLCVKM